MASDSGEPASLSRLPANQVAAAPAGTGPLVEPLLDELLSDTVARSGPLVASALAEHRDHRLAWYGDLVGPLRVPASAVPELLAALLPGDHALPIVLIPDPDAGDLLGSLRIARSALLDNHRVALAGVELPFAQADSTADAARLALDALDFTVPAWFTVPAVSGWEPAFDVLAQDGAESIALQLPAPRSHDVFASVAAVLRALIDRELPFAVTHGITGLVSTPQGHGLLNLLCATHAALKGAETTELAALLAEPSPDPLAWAARRMSEADAAILRAFLPTMGCPSIRQMIIALEQEALIAPTAA